MTATRDSNLRDIGDVPALDVWGDTVQARSMESILHGPARCV